MTQWSGTISAVYMAGGTVPHGTRQAMPVAHRPAQKPSETGAQADPAGNPMATQSASRWQVAH